MSTKKYNALLVQKDSISLGWEASRNKVNSLEGEIVSLRSDTALLNDKISELERELKSLDESYSALKSNSSFDYA